MAVFAVATARRDSYARTLASCVASADERRLRLSQEHVHIVVERGQVLAHLQMEIAELRRGTQRTTRSAGGLHRLLAEVADLGLRSRMRHARKQVAGGERAGDERHTRHAPGVDCPSRSSSVSCPRSVSLASSPRRPSTPTMLYSTENPLLASSFTETSPASTVGAGQSHAESQCARPDRIRRNCYQWSLLRNFSRAHRPWRDGRALRRRPSYTRKRGEGGRFSRRQRRRSSAYARE